MDSGFLIMTGISKSYPGVKALDEAALEVSAGECHALAGENGAGKSTLVKILAGAALPDAGAILLGGERVSIRSPIDARALGIAMIYQELNLLPDLTVADNIFLGREPRGKAGFLDRARMLQESRRWLGALHQSIDPRSMVRELSLAEQQVVEIARALSQQARVLILDEPSSSLTERELHNLFALIGRLKSEGLALIYISHRLDEIFRVCDRVTVMRDGRTIAQHSVNAVSERQLVREMVGRELVQVFPPRKEPRDGIVLETTDLRSPRLRGVSISVRRGEIVGLAGLVGSGRTALARAIFGAEPIDAGEIRFEGTVLLDHTPHEAIRRGIGFLTEDRKNQGLLMNLTVRENVTIADLARITVSGLLSREKERSAVKPLIESLRIKTPSSDQVVAYLSGGNQQKTVLARWLFCESRLLIFDEPTRGIDVGAKSEIYQLITDLAGRGRSILVISSELPEILGLCHRIYVMREGAIAGEYLASEASQEQLLAAAMDVAPQV